MPLDLYQNMMTPDRLRGSPLTSTGTTVFVCNTDTEAVTGISEEEGKDPWGVAAGTHTNHGNVRPVAVPPGVGLYLDLRHAYVGVGYPNVVTAPQVRIYGKVPTFPGINTNDRHWPSDDDSSYPALTQAQGWWVELQDSGGAELITLDNESDNEASTVYLGPTSSEGDDMRISRGRYVHLQGVLQIQVHILRAAIYADSGDSSASVGAAATGMIIGRFVG